MITVYSEHSSARLNYILNILFKETLDVPFTLVHEISDGIHINYSSATIEKAFQIVPCGLLFETSISEQKIDVEIKDDAFQYRFFQTKGTLDFDVLSASFFLISRYEEYYDVARDNHDRYLAYHSLAYKNNFLEIPLVNNWFVALKNQLETHFQISIPFKTQYKIINTIDVDNAFAYKFKGFKRTVGAHFKNALQGNFSEIAKRKAVLKNGKKDPYDTFEYIKTLTSESTIETYFFILLGDFGGFDRNISHLQADYQEVLADLATWSSLGIHPSYKSYLDGTQITIEIERLQTILKKPIHQSRQHFLKLHLPESYQLLEHAGIKEDFTMGYAESFGFRASICTPYHFYDLENEKITDLTIRPFAYMDGTLNEYLHLSVDEAKRVIEELKERVKAVNGHFIGIWHNDTVGENLHWKGWQQVFELALTL